MWAGFCSANELGRSTTFGGDPRPGRISAQPPDREPSLARSVGHGKSLRARDGSRSVTLWRSHSRVVVPGYAPCRPRRFAANSSLTWVPLSVACIVRPGRHCASGGEPTTGLQPGSTPGRYEKDDASMKVIDTPRTNKIGNMVAYILYFGQCFRSYVIPRYPKSPAQSRMRSILGSSSRAWGRKLTELQRQRWVATAQQVPSHPSLAQYSHLSGQQLCVQINSTLQCIGQAPVAEPPDLVVFTPNPVGDLAIVNDEAGGVRLLLTVGSAAEDIMLFGETPRSTGRMKHRRVCYLGLLGPTTDGQCDITAQYTARFGQPSPGQKIFVITCQVKNGWKGQDHLTSAIVPPQPLPGKQQSNEETKVPTTPTTAASEAHVAPAQAASPAPRNVYKGSTPDALKLHSYSKRGHSLSTLCAPLVHGLQITLAKLRTLEMPGARNWLAHLPGSSSANWRGLQRCRA